MPKSPEVRVKIRRIILDMDGVLTDFVSAACKAWGVTVDQITPHWRIGDGWDMAEPIEKALDITIKDFWAPIDNRAEFWEQIKETPWHDDIRQIVHQVCDHKNVRIVTTPSSCATSYIGKTKWLKNQYGEGFDRFAIYPYKEEFAQNGVVLIDDNEKNCAKFVEAGGFAVLFPAYYNRLYEYRFDPVQYVYNELKTLAKIG